MAKSKQIPGFGSRVVKKSISQSRNDVRTWKNALSLATRPDCPRQYKLQEIYDDIMLDATLTSQIDNRLEQTVSADFELVAPNGNVDDGQTAALNAVACLRDIIRYALESEWYNNSLVELELTGSRTLSCMLIPRKNVVAETGLFYPDYLAETAIAYREMKEYGTWLLEFNSGHAGRLNKAVSMLLFKKFAVSCWSELCEIYGIPPRTIKTNTQDPAMLERAEKMMKDMGAAAWFIIDSTEEFQFAQGVNTNGDVYKNLIQLCNNEVSMLVSGAIIGQDTANGNRSKEEISISLLESRVRSDKRMVEGYMNSIVLPALRNLGIISGESLVFRFAAVEDSGQLWERVVSLLPHKEVDSVWITEKFGIPVKDKVPAGGGLSALSADDTGGFDPFA
jgi:phage gp29-like protein